MFFSGLFLKGKLIREGEAEVVQATLYCSVLMVVHTSPRLQEVPFKARNSDQKSLLMTAVTLASSSAVFGICTCSYPTLGPVGRTPQKPSFYKSPHFTCRSSVIVASRARKAQKHQLPVKIFRKCIWQRSSNSWSQAELFWLFTQYPLEKNKNRIPKQNMKRNVKKKILMWWQMNSGAVSKGEKQLQRVTNSLVNH